MLSSDFISVIIPCFNEEKVIEMTHKEVVQVLQSHFEKYEIVYVNDGSKDLTRPIIDRLKSTSNFVQVIHFTRNFGHEAATSAGLHACTGDYAVILDADLQDPPKYIPEMLQTLKENHANVVYGVRVSREGETWLKKITSKLFYRILNYLSDIEIPIDTGDFRLVDKRVIQSFRLLHEKNKFIRGLITWVGYHQMPFYYQREARAAGDTHYSLLKLIKLAIMSTIYYSKKPLQIATNLGLTFVIVSLIYLCFLIVQKLRNPELILAGWTTVISLIVFFGGFILFSIGVLGIYIGNIFDEVKNRPEYLIDQ